jgi:hypothetical protein
MAMRESLLLEIQRALLGVVPASLRAVTCGWSDKQIILRFIFDGAFDEEDKESMQFVGTEVIAGFPEYDKVTEEIIRVDYPNDLRSYSLQAYAYLRKEKMISPSRPSRTRPAE